MIDWSSDNPFLSARSFIERLYKLRVGDRELGNYLVLDRYNLTPSYATKTLFDLTPETDQAVPKKTASRALALLTTTLLIIVSCWAALALIVRRTRVLIYSSDVVSSQKDNYDNRMEAVYRALNSNNISIFELFHTLPGTKFIQHILRRRRIALYLEACDVLFSFCRRVGIVRIKNPSNVEIFWQDISDDERPRIRRMIEKHFVLLARSAFRIRVLTKLFNLSALRYVIAMDDPRHNREIIVASKRAGIQTIEVQHGAFSKYNLGHLGFPWLNGELVSPDRLYVWSNYWKQELLALGTYIPESVIQVGGWDLSCKTHRTYRDGEILGVLIPYETAGQKTEIGECIQILEKNSDVRIFFKVRRDRSRQEQIEEYRIKESDHLLCVDDLGSVLPSVHVIVGTYSTLLYEMAAEGIPIAVLQTSTDFGERLVTNGIAKAIENSDELIFQLKNIAKLPQPVITSIQKKLLGDKLCSMSATLSETLASLGGQNGVPRSSSLPHLHTPAGSGDF